MALTTRQEALQRNRFRTLLSLLLISGVALLLTNDTFRSFLNHNAQAIQALCAVAIAAITAVYVVYTGRMWAEMRETNIRLQMPDVQVSLEQNPVAKHVFDLVIRNQGNVSVSDLAVTVEPVEVKGIGGRRIDALELFHTTFPTFVRGAELRTTLFNTISQPIEGHLTFVATFLSPDGKVNRREYRYDIAAYKGMGWLEEKTFNDAVNVLASIETHLKGISGSSDRLADVNESRKGFEESISASPDRLAEGMRAFVTAWEDALVGTDEDRVELSTSILRERCSWLYGLIAVSENPSPSLEGIRPLLLRMSRMSLRVGNIEEFKKLGSEIVTKLRVAEKANSAEPADARNDLR